MSERPDDRFGFEEVETTTKEEWLRDERSFFAGLPRAVRLSGGPRDGEVVDGGASDYVEVTAYGDVHRVAVWAPKEGREDE